MPLTDEHQPPAWYRLLLFLSQEEVEELARHWQHKRRLGLWDEHHDAGDWCVGMLLRKVLEYDGLGREKEYVCDKP